MEYIKLIYKFLSNNLKKIIMGKKEKPKRVSITYHLTLDKAAITYKNGIYTGKDPQSTWSPINPDKETADGWQNGDILSVVCTFDLNPVVKNELGQIEPQPGANEYSGLCVGACMAGTDDVSKLINKARGLALPNVGQILTLDASKPTIITDAVKPPNTAIFYNAIKSTYTYTLNKVNNITKKHEKLNNYIYKWELTYNGNNTVVKATKVKVKDEKTGKEKEVIIPKEKNVEIVFGYGDPHVGDQGNPLEKEKSTVDESNS